MTLFATDRRGWHYIRARWQEGITQDLYVVKIPGMLNDSGKNRIGIQSFLEEPHIQEVAILLNNSLDKAGFIIPKIMN